MKQYCCNLIEKFKKMAVALRSCHYHFIYYFRNLLLVGYVDLFAGFKFKTSDPALFGIKSHSAVDIDHIDTASLDLADEASSFFIHASESLGKYMTHDICIFGICEPVTLQHVYGRPVINERIPNPFMPDTPYRIATDTSQKLSIRFGETVKAYMKSDTLKVSDLKFIPLVYAGWLRYLMAVDDEGNAFTPSPDPLLETSQAQLSGMKLGDEPDNEKLNKFLRNETVFGVDLVEAGLSDMIIGYFGEMVKGVGAVRHVIGAL
jgi:hypothetical protein